MIPLLRKSALKKGRGTVSFCKETLRDTPSDRKGLQRVIQM